MKKVIFVFIFCLFAINVFAQQEAIIYTLRDEILREPVQQAGEELYIEYNDNKIGPFARFFRATDELDNLTDFFSLGGKFLIKEINNHIFFIVLATKPVSWGLEGYDDSFPIIGYNGKIYYPKYDPGSDDKLFYAISEDTNTLVYIKQVEDSSRTGGLNWNNKQLFNGDTPISEAYEVLQPLKISDSGVYYIAKKHGGNPSVVCYNETTLFNIEDRTIGKDDIQITSNNNMFYKTGGYFGISTIYRNGKVFYEPNTNISDFVVSDDDNIAYTVGNRDGSMSIFRNGKEYYRSPGMILNPAFSPDGTKLYFFEAGQDRDALAFIINGPNIPRAIAGPYLRPSGYEHISFSSDSKYVAFVLESYQRNARGMCIILNDRKYGPYRNIRNYHFSANPNNYSFEFYDGESWNQQVIELK